MSTVVAGRETAFSKLGEGHKPRVIKTKCRREYSEKAGEECVMRIIVNFLSPPNIMKMVIGMG